MTLGVLVNWLAAALLAFTIFFYAVVYTMWLKRWTPQNIVIGGAAGAFPPVIGWAAATGSVSLESVILFLIIFLWTPPHFWALALFKSDEYGRAGIPMMPNVAGAGLDAPADLRLCAGRRAGRRAALVLGYAGAVYGVVAAALGAGFVWYAWKVLRMPDGDRAMRPAKALFAYSLLYLFAHLRRLSRRRGRRSALLGAAGSSERMELETVTLTEARRRRAAAARSRSALALGAFVVIFYVASDRASSAPPSSTGAM